MVGRIEFFTTDLDGVTLINPGMDERRSVLESVISQEALDFPEVYLTSGNGRVLGYRSGGVLFEEEDGEAVRLIRGADIDLASKAWTFLVTGETHALDALPWSYPED